MKYVAYVKEINDLMSAKEKRLAEAERVSGGKTEVSKNHVHDV
ncbi:MAG TPA: hypothetical protein VMX38_01290 [Verrucomicrobiae bacterium]|nr:hypothetical protein [Verrucomicrobiae bacterium]